MRAINFGTLGVVGTMLAFPAMAQSWNQNPGQNGWQQQGQPGSGYNQNQAFNGPNMPGGNNQGGGFNAPGGNWNNRGYAPGQSGSSGMSQNGPWAGSGYGPGAANQQSNNFGANGYNQGGNQGRFSNRQFAAQEVHALRMALEQAGFSDIRILPESFLVQARDRDGRRVLMLISPRGFEAVTAVNPGPRPPITGGTP